MSDADERVRMAMRVGRAARGWNQATLADAATDAGGRSITRTTISKIEAGREPKLWEMAAISAALNIDLNLFKPDYIGNFMLDIAQGWG